MKKSKSVRAIVGPERMVLADGLQPFLCATSKGTLFVQAQLTAPAGVKFTKSNIIPGHSTIGNVISRDRGATWERWAPKEWPGQSPYFEGAFAELSDGRILMIEWVARPTSRRGMLDVPMWESRDDLKTLRGPIIAKLHLPQARTNGFDDGGEPYTGVTFHRTLLEMPNHDLLATIYCWFKIDNTPCPYQPKMKKFRSVLIRSSDRGRNWEFVSTIAADSKVGEEGFNETAMARVSRGPHKGRLVSLIRTGCFDCPIYQVTSDDDGATWSKPAPQKFAGVSPDLLEMRDGTLACSFGWRAKSWTERKPPARFGNKLIFSRDGGDTWRDLTHVPIEPNAHTPWTTCYTAMCEIRPKELLLFYDIGRWGQAVRYIGSRRIISV